jgi:ribosomal protein S18 acetylase RimI-like enzyme
MNNEEYYTENVIIDRDDLYINMDKFESGKCNVILVTGFSGSGKSTLGQEMVSKYKCDDHIELDALEWWFNKAITEDELKNGLTPIYDWLIHHKSEMNMEKPTEKQIMEMYDDAIPYVINWCKKHSDKKYVIDGIQLYENWANKGKCQYLSYPMVLKGTSGLKSIYRAMKRNGNRIIDLPFYLKWLARSNKQVDALYKAMKEAYENEEVTEEVHEHHDEADAMTYAMNFLNKYSDRPFTESVNKKVKYAIMLNVGKDKIKEYSVTNKYLSHFRISPPDTNCTFLVDESDDKKLIGAINIEKKIDGIWIQALEVSKSYQKHGYGKILVDLAKNQHATKLTVRKTNESAIRLYEKCGFVIEKEFNANQYLMTTRKKDKVITENADSEYQYTPVKESDMDDFIKDMNKAFHIRYDRKEAEHVRKDMKAIKRGDTIVGYVGLSHYKQDGKKYIGLGNFMIKPEYQGKGYGRSVIKDIIAKNDCDEIYCYVDKKNTAAISFYKKIGTVDTDHLTKYGYYVTLYSKDTKPYQEESFMSEYLQSSHKRKKKVVRNDEGKIVPDKCPKCGGDIGVFIQGEPVYLCKNCKKYFGTVKFPSKKKKAVMESVDPECECLVAFMEAAVKNTTILKDLIYSIVEKTFTTQANVRKYKMLISQFFEKNTPKLTTPGPQYLIVFGDADKDEFYKLFGITKEEIVFAMKNVIKSAGSSAEFKYLTNNPFLSFLYYIIRYFTLHHDDKALNATLGLFSIDVYWSIFTKYFPNGVIEPVMNYTIDNLTDKFIIKKAGTIFGALTESAKHSYEFHKSKIRTGNDPDCIAFLQRIRNDQNSMFRTISGIYYDNHKKGNAITTRNDDYDPENPILDDITSASTEVQATVNRVCMPMIANGVDISLAEAASAIGNVSVTNLRIYLMKIFVNERLDEITQIVESILFLYINGEHKSSRDIRSAHFLYWTYALFKKTNSKDGNIVRINTILNRWGEETGIYKAFKSEGSKINYKRAIFTYIAMCIQKYN